MTKENLTKVRIKAEYDAMLSMARIYCGVIYGAIAIVLSKPEVVKATETHYFEFRYTNIMRPSKQTIEMKNELNKAVEPTIMARLERSSKKSLS